MGRMPPGKETANEVSAKYYCNDGQYNTKKHYQTLY